MSLSTLLSLLLIPSALRAASKAAQERRELEADPSILHPMRNPASLARKQRNPPGLSASWIRAQFRRTDDGAGGPLQTLRRGIKFWARCLWHVAPLRLSVGTFRKESLDSVVQGEPAVQSRPLRSYLRHGLSAANRARAVKSHFTWLSVNLPPALIDRLYLEGPVTLLQSTAQRPGLLLSRASGLGREGELALHLEWSGVTLMSLAFSALEAGAVLPGREASHLNGTRAVVGALQGARGADTALRELSTHCQRLRPSALLLIALQALSAGWGLQAPMCVAARSHVYAGYRSPRRKAALDYDSVWQSSGGEPAGRHYWLLPARPVLRPDSEVESKKRAQHRRKNLLRDEFFASTFDAAQSLLKQSV
jgi:uncharacterized protein VirK/YbjX